LFSVFPKQYKQFFLKKPNLNFKNIIKQNNNRINNISLLSYNILASGYTSPSVYYYVKPDYLDDEHRLNMITFDLLSTNSDIICLQEVEKKSFDSHISKTLINYEGIYSKRVGLNCDGLAILYKKELFNKVDFYTIDLNKCDSNSKIHIPSFVKNLIKTNNIAQILILEPLTKAMKESIDYLIVVNIHLHWDPTKEIIKYLQMSEILNRVHDLREEIKLDESYKKKNPIFICGDFNSTPESNVLNLTKNLCTSTINKNLSNINNLSYSEINITNLFHEIKKNTHNLNLFDPHCETDKSYFTNIKSDFKEKIDYILYSEDFKFNSIDISNIELEEYVSEIGLPNSFHGSDHIFVMSRFYL